MELPFARGTVDWSGALIWMPSFLLLCCSKRCVGVDDDFGKMREKKLFDTELKVEQGEGIFRLLLDRSARCSAVMEPWEAGVWREEGLCM